MDRKGRDSVRNIRVPDQNLIVTDLEIADGGRWRLAFGCDLGVRAALLTELGLYLQ